MNNYLTQNANTRCPCTEKARHNCPNVKYDEKAGGFEYELYVCDCGYSYKLYYEDMQ